jgi:uncharacterized protein (DUF1330 family)
MPVYVIFNQKITDIEKYKEYSGLAAPLVQKYGGKIVVAEPNADILEGSPFPMIAILEFESKEAAHRWYNSPEVQGTIAMRFASTEGWAVTAPKYMGKLTVTSTS